MSAVRSSSVATLVPCRRPWLPALAISLLALGVLQRDGLWAQAGLVAAAVSAVVVSGVVFAMVKAGLDFFAEVRR